MSLVFGASQGGLGQIRANMYGIKITLPDGRKVDTGVQQLAEDVVNVMQNLGSPGQPTELNQPIVLINNQQNMPAILVINRRNGPDGPPPIRVVERIVVNEDNQITKIIERSSETTANDTIGDKQRGEPDDDTISVRDTPPPPPPDGGFSGQIDCVTDCDFSIEISGCDVSIVPVLTVTTLSFENGRLVSGL